MNTVNPLYSDTRYNNKIRYNGNLNVTKTFAENVAVNKKNMQDYCIKTSSKICFGYLLESPHSGDSNKNPKHMFCEEIRIKQCLSYISFCPLKSLYNSKFILIATLSAINAAVVTRAHCITSNRLELVEAILMSIHNTYVHGELDKKKVVVIRRQKLLHCALTGAVYNKWSNTTQAF